jgi:hypothetical protein
MIVSLLVVVALVGCTKPKILSTDEATKIIEEGSWFKEPLTVRLATGELPSGAMTVGDFEIDQIYRTLKALDLIEIKAGSSPLATTVSLTERGKEASEQWEWRRSTTGDGVRTWDVWEIPVATRDLVQVSPPQSGVPDTAVVEFSWKWVPNPLGEKLTIPTKTVKSSGSFIKDANGWRLVT